MLAVAHITAADVRLARVVQAVGPYDVTAEGDVDVYAHLIRTIVFQQLNGTAAATIHRRLLGLFDDAVPTPEQLLATTVEDLRGVGVSGSKAASLHDLAHHVRSGELPEWNELLVMPDASIVERLTIVRGIGPWTVHMLLMFRLGRPDVLPTGDFGVREGWRMLTGADKQLTPSALRSVAETWRPYRSVGAWYCWRAVDLARSGELSLDA